MSYEVTATRRRPQQFENLVGQEFVAETLKNSIKSGKIAHAYLFTGPRGCGKTSTARILAKALNCQNGPTDHPCGQCAACQEITRGASLDVIEIDGASNTSVDNIRRIKDEVMFPPTNCRYKIYIIDEVHMLTNSAFNALLKTIEEPPEYVIFIFATTELQKVPATIKSRCQQFNFRLVPIEKVKACLADACHEMNITYDDEALFWIARESTGSMRDAYTLFDQVVAFSDGHITYDKIRDKLGLVGIDRLNTIFELCADSKTEEVLNALDGFLQAGVSIEQLISTCADYLRSLLLIKNGITREALLGNSVERYSKKVLSSWNTVQTERALSLYLNLYRDIRYSLSPRYELELLFSRMCWIKDYVSPSEVKKAIDAAQALLSGAPSASASQAAPVQSSAQPGAPVNAGSMNQNFGSSQAAPQGGFSPAGSESAASQAFQNASFSSMQSVPSFQSTPSDGPLESQIYGSSQPQQPSGIPAGMPTFSALANVPPDAAPEPEPDSGNGPEVPGENPFNFGGELPPEQSASPAEPFVNESFSNPEPQESQPVSYSSEYQPVPEGSYAPEDSVPPEYDEGSSDGQPPAQTNEFITTADNRQISIAQLRGTVTASLSVSDGFSAIALQNTGLWKIQGDKIITTVKSDYEMQTFRMRNQDICKAISSVLGRPVFFEVSVEKIQPKETVKEEIPPGVQLVIDMFKGSL